MFTLYNKKMNKQDFKICAIGLKLDEDQLDTFMQAYPDIYVPQDFFVSKAFKLEKYSTNREFPKKEQRIPSNRFILKFFY